LFDRYQIAAAALLLLTAASSAQAQTGGAVAPGPPKVDSVECLAAGIRACGKPGNVVRGQEAVVRGASLQSIERLVFAGSRGRRDNTAAEVSRGGERYAVAQVPEEAQSGPVLLVGASGRRVARAGRVTVREAPQATPKDIAPESSFFYGGRRKATFSFSVDRPGDIQVELVSEKSQEIIRRWRVAAQPGQTARIRWGGRGAEGVEPVGRYRFRVAGAASASAVVSPEAATGFFFADHVFPIRGRHDRGQAPTNDFGGGGARAHKGQDMFAACGTRLAAARGGTVQFAGYHSAAGNYLVIDGRGTEMDYVYMHMSEPALVRTGGRVFTGQKVGEVGETGRATGCHLHFELWSGPGWFEGGSAFDPLPSLEAWDAYS